ncbi:MAG: DNA polymerase III subunit gamma/tau [Bacillota bacterium]|nr:DNA polymerase III subunit gamma/tau [Bacillota bacterium]
MAYLSLYRKWRPQRFEDVVAQEHVVRTLQNALRAGRIAHAYLFCGPRGTGKTTLAKLLAKALNCQEGPTPDPCGRCLHCRQVAEGTSLDVSEIDGASNRGIDEVRELRERVKLAPAAGRYRIYIIDEVHMLTTEAFNALLKTLEEPPPHVIFIFATTEPHKVPATILSRCQRFDFHRIPVEELEAHLQKVAAAEGLEIEAGAVRLLARTAEGGLRDALSLLDQCFSFAGRRIRAEDVQQLLGVADREEIAALVQAVAAGDVAAALSTVARVGDGGKDVAQFTRDLVRHFRNLMLWRAGARHLVECDERERALVEEQASAFSLPELAGAVDALFQALNEFRWTGRYQLPLELALLRILERRAQASGREAAVAAEPAAEAPAAPVPRQPAPLAQAPRAEAAAAKAAAAAPPEQSAGEKEQADLLQRWPEYLEVLKKKSIKVQAFLREGKPVGVEGGKVRVRFPRTLAFHYNEINRPANRKVAEAALREYYGRELQLECSLEEGGEGTEGTGEDNLATGRESQREEAPAAGTTPAPLSDPLTRYAVELFKAKVIQVEAGPRRGGGASSKEAERQIQ